MKNIINYIIIVFFISSCCDQNKCPINLYENLTNYKVNINIITQSGFKIDSGDKDINVKIIDQQISKIENCLNDLYLSGYVPNERAECFAGGVRPTPIDRECLKIKIVDGIESSISDWKLLPVEAPMELCFQKEQLRALADNNHVCRWRWLIQDDYTLITPLSHKSGEIYLYEIVRIHTGCNGYWFDNELSNCAMIWND